MSDSVMSIAIKNSRPVELQDLTVAFQSVADQYQRFVKRGGYGVNGVAPRLYIKEIRSGSIITEIFSMAPQASFLVENYPVLIDFIKDIKSVYDFFLKKGVADPKREVSELKDFSQILQPIAHDPGGNINISVNGSNVGEININSIQASSARRGIKNQIAKQNQAVSGLFEKELFYWFQVRNDTHSSVGDKGCIENISDKNVRVIFVDEKIKSIMISNNIFNLCFIVDVEVQTVRGIPACYKIMKVHDIFPFE